MSRPPNPVPDRVLIGLALALATGCASITSGQRPETLGKGRVEVGVETAYQAALEPDTVLAFPIMSATTRVGVSERVDLGGRASTSGLGVQTKVLLHRGARLTVSIAPRSDWVHAFEDGVGFDTFETAMPALSSFRVHDGLELLASGRLHSSTVAVKYSDTYWAHTLGIGGSGGVAVRTGKMWLVTELGLLYPFLITGKPADEMGGTTTRLDRIVAQLSFTVLFGGSR